MYGHVGQGGNSLCSARGSGDGTGGDGSAGIVGLAGGGDMGVELCAAGGLGAMGGGDLVSWIADTSGTDGAASGGAGAAGGVGENCSEVGDFDAVRSAGVALLGGLAS